MLRREGEGRAGTLQTESTARLKDYRSGTTNDANASIRSLRHLEVDISQTEQEARFQAEQSMSCGSAVTIRVEPRLSRRKILLNRRAKTY